MGHKELQRVFPRSWYRPPMIWIEDHSRDPAQKDQTGMTEDEREFISRW